MFKKILIATDLSDASKGGTVVTGKRYRSGLEEMPVSCYYRFRSESRL